MKKLTLFTLLSVVVFLTWCSMSDLTWGSNGTWENIDTEPQTCSIATDDCGTETWDVYEILNGEYSWNQENMSKIIKIFDDLNVIDNSYWYSTKQAWKKIISLSNGDELLIKSGSVFLKKDGKVELLFSNDNKNDELWWILGLDEKVVALFWPYENVFENDDVSFAYITKSSYWDWVKQYLYSITQWKKVKSDTLLYHNKENNIVIETSKSNWKEQYNYKGMVISKDWWTVAVTWMFDSFSFNWNVLYHSTTDFETNLSDVWKFDLWTLKDKKVLSQKNIWHEWKFFVIDGVVYVSFWVIDFVNDNVSHHISAYNENGWELLWEAKIMNN